jgi:hypothetical protein
LQFSTAEAAITITQPTHAIAENIADSRSASGAIDKTKCNSTHPQPSIQKFQAKISKTGPHTQAE